MAVIPADKLYQAVQSGKVDPRKLSDEHKAMLKQYITTKNQPGILQRAKNYFTEGRDTVNALTPEQQTGLAKTLGAYNPPKDNAVSAFGSNALSSALLGVADKQVAQAYPNNPIASTAGKVVGTLVPFGVAYKGAKAAVAGLVKLFLL